MSSATASTSAATCGREPHTTARTNAACERHKYPLRALTRGCRLQHGYTIHEPARYHLEPGRCDRRVADEHPSPQRLHELLHNLGSREHLRAAQHVDDARAVAADAPNLHRRSFGGGFAARHQAQHATLGGGGLVTFAPQPPTQAPHTLQSSRCTTCMIRNTRISSTSMMPGMK